MGVRSRPRGPAHDLGCRRCGGRRRCFGVRTDHHAQSTSRRRLFRAFRRPTARARWHDPSVVGASLTAWATRLFEIGGRGTALSGTLLPKPRRFAGGAGLNPGCHRSVWHARAVLDSGEDLAHLTDAERAWVRHSEQLWTQAHLIAAACPSIDVGDVYHSLRCLELSPSERLARGLSRGRLRTYTR